MLMQPLETDLGASTRVVNVQPMYEPTTPSYGSVNTAFAGYTMLNQYNTLFHPFSPWPIIPTGYQYTAPAPSSPLMGTAQEDSGEAPRPFNAYTDDKPPSPTLSSRSNTIFDEEVKKSYSEFKNKVLGSAGKTKQWVNARMRRTKHRQVGTSSAADEEDPGYLERRRKNNEAARKSREARKAKEDEIAIRVAFLEKEYLRLQCENKVLKNENLQYKGLLFKNPSIKYCFERIESVPN